VQTVVLISAGDLLNEVLPLLFCYLALSLIVGLSAAVTSRGYK